MIHRTPLNRFSVIKISEEPTVTKFHLSMGLRNTGISYLGDHVYIIENILKGIFIMTYGDNKIKICL